MCIRDSYCTSAYISSEYGRISVDDFKQELDSKTGKSKIEEKPKSPPLFKFIQQELEEMESSGMRKASLGPFHRHVKVLKKFASERGSFNYEDVDWELRLELIDWLNSKSFQLSYGNKVLSSLRQFMERARKKKFHNNTSYQGKGWYVPRKKAVGQKAVLNPKELSKLSQLEVYGFEAKVRDLFLIGAGTGQRFSDYSQYKPENFYHTLNGTPILSVISQKTDIPAKIPLNIFPWLIPVLERHEYCSPKVSMQKFNYCIKELCRRLGFDDNILIVEQYISRKARVETHYSPKYKEIASHTCRRSFATNLYRMGYQLGQIMPMTGHATESQLREYIGIDAEENAENIASDIRRRRLNED